MTGPPVRRGVPTGNDRRRRRAALAAAGVLVLAMTVVVVHDAACTLSFSTGRLCERPDGTLWRDDSWGCFAGEDPACEDGCVDSRMVSEGPRRSCSWVLQRNEWPANGEPPYHVGPSPGSGVPVDP